MEEMLEKDLVLHFSRNLKNAMVRNTIQDGSLQKDLKYMQRQRRRLAHWWEMKKHEFAQRQKCGKLPLLGRNSDETEKEDSKGQILEQRSSRESSATHSKYSKSVLGRKELSSQQSGVDKQVYSKLGGHETNLEYTTLTVKDISKILSSDKRSPSMMSDVQCPSPSTQPRFNGRSNTLHALNKETAKRNDISSPLPPRPPMQYLIQRSYRTCSLDTNELNKISRESKLTSSFSSVPLRKRATTWNPKHSELVTLLGPEQIDSESKNSLKAVKVCVHF